MIKPILIIAIICYIIQAKIIIRLLPMTGKRGKNEKEKNSYIN